MTYSEASRLADKTSRTIAKLEQLVEVINSPGYSGGDPNRIVERYCERMKSRINKRLTTLARWSDSSTDERQAEFRQFFPSSSYNAYRPNATTMNSPSSMHQRPVAVQIQIRPVVAGKPTLIPSTEPAPIDRGNVGGSIVTVEQNVFTASNSEKESSAPNESVASSNNAELENSTNLSNGTNSSPSKPIIKEEMEVKLDSDQISPQGDAIL
jgi:hypothetical protein